MPLGVALVCTKQISLAVEQETNKSYIHNGISFSFVEKTRYWKPKSQEDLKIGMVVEYQNNNKWYERIVRNPKEEWCGL